MVKKKYLSLSVLFLVITLLFVGCSSSNNVDKNVNDQSKVKVESDENKVQNPTVPVTTTDNQSVVENTASNELIASDDIEIGSLI